jgi:hypothetical protein
VKKKTKKHTFNPSAGVVNKSSQSFGKKLSQKESFQTFEELIASSRAGNLCVSTFENQSKASNKMNIKHPIMKNAINEMMQKNSFKENLGVGTSK